MTARWRICRSALTGAAAVLVATSCTSGESGTPATSPTGTDESGAPSPVVLVAGSDTPGAGDARVSGTLVESGGCLAVQGPEVTYPAVWPARTRWNGGGIVLPDGSSLQLGDQVDLGGSYTRDVPEDVTPDLPAGCAESAEFVVIDIGS